MSSDDPQAHASWPLEEQASSKARRILGPFRPLSWGIISPLLRRLEQQGLVESVIEQRWAGLPAARRGQPPRSYALTPAGRERFLSLLLTPGP